MNADDEAGNPESAPVAAGRVLVVDDNPDFLNLMTLLLSDTYQVFLAWGGEEGIELAWALRPDVMVVDAMMPDISGLEVVRRLGQDERTRGIPVIVVTAHHLTPALRRFYEEEENVKAVLDKAAGASPLRSGLSRVFRA